MGLQRVGVLLLALGLLVATMSAVAFGTIDGRTDVGCEDHEPTYSFVGLDPASLSVEYTDGCNLFSINPLVTAGGGLAVLGSLIGAGGVAQARRRAEPL
jgi:hypothetical protein